MYGGELSPLSNRQSWTDSVEVRDQDTGELVDISTASEIVVQVAPTVFAGPSGYGDVSNRTSPLLTATLANGKVRHVQTGIFNFAFSKGDMRGLVGGVYDVEIVIEKDGETESLILGIVPVHEGVVTI